jgi:transcriptional regulator with XRE-family HTH domain
MKSDKEMSSLPASASDDPVAALGPQIRSLRRRSGLTLAQLAERAELSIGHLSQVERSLSTPTIKQLQAISRAMGVNIGSFFQAVGSNQQAENDRGIVVRAGRRKVLSIDGLGIVDELLVPSLEGALELLLCTIAPGAESGEAYSHEGEEAGFILSGNLELWVDEQYHYLEEGDSFAFASSRPHRYRNPGSIPVKVIWAITPPTY